MEVEKRSYGVDVSSYNSTNLSQFVNLGAKFALVKLSEGLNYQNPKAKAQLNNAKTNGMLTMGYHYARFSGDSNTAAKEGHYTVNTAKAVGLPEGSYLACDWEEGSGNSITQGYEASADSILVFLDVIVSAGYKPLLYSGKAALVNNVDTKKITAKYGTCLWVASYKTRDPQDTADFGWFPSMDNVAIWQFTSNWHGLDVDANISLIDLKSDDKPALQPSKPANSRPGNEKTWTDVQGMTWHAEDGTFITGGAINLRWGATTQSMIITQLPAGSVVKYNAWSRDSAGRVWLQQPRGSNHYGYLVGRVGNDAWGTFK
ncbi:GH25 family lysozyme [Lactobacillus johnsonii]|uniref:GH25 family lysozyme n=1 Tax=Lactobacillus johnsonii TaxID=33959 RepID=UPI003F5109FA